MPSNLVWTLEYAGRKYEIAQKGLRVGRAADNEVVVPDDQVSRLHATVYAVHTIIFIRDEKSKNGTFVNGKRIATPTPLRSGDQIQIGSAKLVLHSTVAAAHPPAPLPEPAPHAITPESETEVPGTGLGYLFKNAIPLVSRVGFLAGGIVTLLTVIDKISGEMVTTLGIFLLIATLITSGMVVFWRVPKRVGNQQMNVYVYPRKHRLVAGIILGISSILTLGLAIQLLGNLFLHQQEQFTSRDSVQQSNPSIPLLAPITGVSNYPSTPTSSYDPRALSSIAITSSAEQKTVTAQAEVTAAARTRAVQPTISTLISKAKRIYGPNEGTLDHKEGYITNQFTSLKLRNFIADVRFYNPYDRAERGWDYGIGFRDTGSDQQYRLVIDSNSGWNLNLVSGKTGDKMNTKTIASGRVEKLDLSASGSNVLRLVVQDTAAIFIVNGEYVSTLDVSEKTAEGDVFIGTGFFSNNKLSGKATRYAEFAVSSLP